VIGLLTSVPDLGLTKEHFEIVPVSNAPGNKDI